MLSGHRIALAIFGLALAASARAEDRVSQLLDVAREAFQSSKANLRSGSGSGVFENYTEKPGESKGAVTRGRLKASFKGNKYHVRLDFEDLEKLKRRIIVCDGSLILSSQFWPRPNGGIGSEGYVYHPSKQHNKPLAVAFPWDLSRPWILDVDAFFLKNRELVGSLTVAELARQGFDIKSKVGKTGFTIIQFREQFGFNACKRASFREENSSPVEVDEVTWKKQDGLWFIDSLANEIDLRFRDAGLMKWKMKYEQFDLNQDVSDSLFTLDALELREKDRILDFQPGQKTRQFVYTKKRKMSEKSLNEMLAQVDDLPEMGVRPPRTGRSTFRLLTVVGMGLLLMILIFRWRSKKAIERKQNLYP